MEEPEPKLARATALVSYYVRRNEVARRSHAKTWRAKYRGVKFLRLITGLTGLARRGPPPGPVGVGGGGSVLVSHRISNQASGLQEGSGR
jgi:hypothetical protein